MLELRHLRYLVALAETGSFARAAERELITQSALSQQIARLERHLGILLFERGPRGSRLTREGEEVLTAARVILAEVARLESSAESMAHGLRGVYRIGSPTFAVTNPVRRKIEQRFQEIFPHLAVRFENAWSLELENRVRHHQLDATFTMLPGTNVGLEKLRIDRASAKLVMRRDAKLAQNSALAAGALGGMRVLVYPRSLSEEIYDEIAHRLAAVGAIVSELQEPSLPAILDEVRRGGGVFVAVPWEVGALRLDRSEDLAVARLSPDAGITYGLWLAKRAGDHSAFTQGLWEAATSLGRGHST